MNIFNEAEYFNMCKKLASDALITDVSIQYSLPGYFNRIRKRVKKDRRGEVVFCVIRPDGRIIVTACSDYPEGIYRIPTGGIGHNEDIVEAVFREVKEELGLEVKIRSFGGVIRICFKYGSEQIMFYSYIFILDETGGRLLEDASDDEISEAREVDLEELAGIVGSLKNIEGKWRDWGQFRYVTSNAVLQYLEKKCIKL